MINQNTSSPEASSSQLAASCDSVEGTSKNITNNTSCDRNTSNLDPVEKSELGAKTKTPLRGPQSSLKLVGKSVS